MTENPLLSATYLLIILVLAGLSLTRRRIYVICGFYCVYGFVKVLGLGSVMDWAQLAVFRALYLVLLVSVGVRFVQDRAYLAQLRRWPLVSYSILLALFLASALYSPSSEPFSQEPWNLRGLLTIISLFLLTASQFQEENDLRIFALTTVVVSLALSVWVILAAAQLNFEVLRGGIDVNQNYVSVFVLAGIIPLIHILFAAERGLLKFLLLPVLLVVVLASLILASRGMIAAALVGVVLMAARVARSRGFSALLALIAILVLIGAVAMILPGGDSLAARSLEGNAGTLNDRTLIWSHAMRYFADSGIARMIFGQGLSSGTFVLRPVLPLFENYHNEYLTWLMNQGVLGLAAFLAFLYSVIQRVRTCSHPLKSIMLGWLAFLGVAGLSSTVSDLHLFWILVGVITGASSLAKFSRSSIQPGWVVLRRSPASTTSAPAIEDGI